MHKQTQHGAYERPETSKRRASMRNIKTEREDSFGEDEGEDKENEVRENYCYTCHRQFDNRNGYSVHMSKAHGGGANRNNSNNVAALENEPPSKRAKNDGEFYFTSFGNQRVFNSDAGWSVRPAFDPSELTHAFVLPTRNMIDSSSSSSSISSSGCLLLKHMQL